MPDDMMHVASQASRVLARVENGVGLLTVNRPEAINALDLGMVRAIKRALESWSDDSEVSVVLLDGAGERGLSAGADVRGLYGKLVAGQAAEAMVFFGEEYALDAFIAEYPKPIVAIADGITMGGGIGLAGHASIRVVTERSKLAMPETRIGFTPDAGGSWLLARSPGRLVEYLGITGATMTAADAIHAGFADLFVPSDRLETLRQAVVAGAGSDPFETVRSFAQTPEVSALMAEQEWIDEVFSAADLVEISQGLVATGRVHLLAGLSPMSMAVALESVGSSRRLPGIREALAQEFALVDWFVTTQPDLLEGIRAQLVDKDRDPRWSPARIEDLPAGLAAQALAHLPRRPLWAETPFSVPPLSDE
jgi:enoyl-CoA hydratase